MRKPKTRRTLREATKAQADGSWNKSSTDFGLLLGTLMQALRTTEKSCQDNGARGKDPSSVHAITCHAEEAKYIALYSAQDDELGAWLEGVIVCRLQVNADKGRRGKGM